MCANSQLILPSLLPTIDVPIWKLGWWEETGYAPHPGQTRLHALVNRHQSVEAEMGRQWGKTTWAAKGEAIPEWLRWKDTIEYDWEWPRFVLVIAPFLDQADIIFRVAHDVAHERGIPLERDRSSGKLDLITRDGSQLRCMSGQNPRAMRGPQWHLVIIDEGSYVKGLKKTVDEVIKPTLIARRGKLAIVGSPDAPGSATHEYSLKGDDPSIPEWGHYTGVSTENWHIPHMAAFIESERRQGVPEDILDREYMAKFKPRAGIVYSDYAGCVMNEEEIEFAKKLVHAHGQWARAIDWGYVNPFACITHVRVGETLYAWDEYYVRLKTIDNIAPVLASHDRLYNYEINVADLENPHHIEYCAKYTHQGPKGLMHLKGKWIRRGTKPGQVDRINNLRTLMATGRYRIHPRCRNYIKELGMEKYAEPDDVKNVNEIPIDAHNHCSKAAGYYAWHLFGRKRGVALPFGAEHQGDIDDGRLESIEALEGYHV